MPAGDYWLSIMQPRVTPSEVALVAILLAAVIITGIFAPGVVAVVSSTVSVLVGSFFVNVRKELAAPVPDTLPSPGVVPKEDERGAGQ